MRVGTRIGFVENHRMASFDLFADKSDGQRVFEGELVWKERELNTAYGPPLLHLERDAVQEVFDHLWRMGFRPSDERSEGTYRSLRAHLEDMRAIVFEKLKVPKP